MHDERASPVLQHSAVPSPRFSVGIVALLLSVSPSPRLPAQSVDDLAARFAGMTAVTGLEQAMTDTLLTLLPGSIRDRAGNVTLSLGSGTPRRLDACALDEVGYVVGNITPDGYLTLRRVGAPPTPLFDHQLEGERVTVFGAHGAVPGIGAVRGKPKVRGTVVAAFTVHSLYASTGVQAVQALQGHFGDALLLWSGRRAAAGRAAADPLALATRYTDTAVETVSLTEADALAQRLAAWMAAR